MDFFLPIVSGALGVSLTNCDMTFRYENNSPSTPGDDITVQYPTCIGVPYTPPGNHPCDYSIAKSKEQLNYEKYAKKSKRLKVYEEASPAQIEYFHDICSS